MENTDSKLCPVCSSPAAHTAQGDREALLQAADFIEPALLSNTLPGARCREIAATLRRLADQGSAPKSEAERE